MYYSRFILYISSILSFESFNFGIHIILSSFHSFRHVLLSHLNHCESTVSMPFLVLEIYGLAAYQHHRHCPYHHLHCVHCRHFFSSSGSLSRHVLFSFHVICISIIFSFESFNLGIHIIRSNHSGAFRFLIQTTTSGWCPCHSWSWRSTGWQFTMSSTLSTSLSLSCSLSSCSFSSSGSLFSVW